MRHITGLLIITVLLLFAVSCTHKEPAPAPEKPAVEKAPEKPAEPAPVEVKPEVVKPVEQPAGVEEIPSDIAELNSRGYLNDVFFDFDKYDLKPEFRDTLLADATWLRKYETVKIVIEGHCDERGTREYNLSLGEKRANAARNYLISLGVDSNRIETISYGEDRPFATCHSESCWSQNRRGHIVITAR